ncbi:windbeutel [Carabus blaptoides fortunei]
MYQNVVFAVFLLVISSVNEIHACKGCVNLDESSFNKVLPHFAVTLVKFDVAFPYGDKHEIFTKLADEVASNKDILMAEIGVKDYGEKDNEELAKKFGVTKDDFPAVKLFMQNVEQPISFPKTTDFTLDKLRTFIRDNTNIYLGLPGCLEVFDKLATKFVDAKDQKQTLKEAEKLSKDLKDTEQESAKTYTIVMKKIIENGKKFITQETDRVLKLLKEKISAKKQNELQNRLNILRAFAVPRKDEL